MLIRIVNFDKKISKSIVSKQCYRKLEIHDEFMTERVNTAFLFELVNSQVCLHFIRSYELCPLIKKVSLCLLWCFLT